MGARISHFLLYFIYLLLTNTYVIGDGNNACILVRNFSYKKGWPSATLISGQNFDKSYWFFRNFKQVLLHLCILVLRRGYLDANIKEVCNIISVYLCTHKRCTLLKYAAPWTYERVGRYSHSYITSYKLNFSSSPLFKLLQYFPSVFPEIVPE